MAFVFVFLLLCVLIGSWVGIQSWGRMLSWKNPLYMKLHFLSFGQCTLSSIHTQYFRFTGKKGQLVLY